MMTKHASRKGRNDLRPIAAKPGYGQKKTPTPESLWIARKMGHLLMG